MVEDVRGVGFVVRELCESHRAPDGVEELLLVQMIGERVEVDGARLLLQRDHRLVDRPMRRMVEVLRLELGVDGVQRVVLEQDRREHGLLGLEVLRRDPSAAAAAARIIAPGPASAEPAQRTRHLSPPGW